MRQLVSSRWFALVDLVIISACGAVWYFSQNTGAWLLLAALLPWSARLMTGHMPFQRTRLDLFLLLFVITAGVGLLAAYNREAAWVKFWILMGAVLIYYSLAGQPRANFRVIVTALSGLGVVIAFYFLLTYDWKNLTGDLVIINRLGHLLAGVQPGPGLPALPPNFAGGILAMLLPINFVFVGYTRTDRQTLKTVVAVMSVLIVLVGLFMSSSRGAWLACGAGLMLWGLWRGSCSLGKRTGLAADKIFLTILVVALVIFFVWLVSESGKVVELSEMLPGLPTGGSRVELAQSAIKLIEDYPFTGGGLRAFGGNYSRYIMLNPYFLFAYSHNFYLDVFFEQGLLGGGAILALFGVSLLSLWRIILRGNGQRQDILLAEAALTALVILLIHGVIDDALYGDAGTPLLFLIPGIAMMLFRDVRDSLESQRTIQPSSQVRHKNGWVFFGGVFLVVLIGGILLKGRALQSLWNANLGALMAARWELRDWPAESLNDLQEIIVPEDVLNRLDLAARLNPSQRTAHHRLGLAYMGARDFAAAQEELEIAYQIDPEHRGVRKALGYTLVWVGEIDRSVSLLKDIPEAEYELDAYKYWWRARDRRDLAWQAQQVVNILHGINLEKY